MSLFVQIKQRTFVLVIKNKNIKLYVKIALTLFFISAFYGWLMRYDTVVNLSFFKYTKVLQAHSHVTFLGWGFMSVTTLFNWLFLPKEQAFNRIYKWLFGLEFLCIALMLISFPLQGYKVFSIVLLSIFLITSYLYIVKFYKDLKITKISPTILLFINSSLLFYLISSIGIWAIGIVVATLGKTDLYYNSIYFYLHFLYNGFFVFSLFGLFFYYLTHKGINFSNKKLKYFFWLTFIACTPAFLLSLVDSEHGIIIIIGLIAAVTQVLSLYYLLGLINSIRADLSNNFNGFIKLILATVIIAFILKVLLQLGSGFPQLSNEIITLKSYFVIGYIHLVTLGFVSSMIILLLIELYIFKIDSKLTKIGLLLFLIGVLSTEVALFLQGILVWFSKSTLPHYTDIILMASSLLLLGILSLLLSLFLKKGTLEKEAL